MCICTSGRPAELDRCLASIAAGRRQPLEVIVSDDSLEATTAEAVMALCGMHKSVYYLRGPNRGLCANRNAVIRQAKGSHVSLVDDDAVLGPNFIRDAEALVAECPNVVFTGDVLEDGTHRQSPTSSTLLGHFGRPVGARRLENVNLNCNVFPRSAFDLVQFDEFIAYGYEDTDLCARLVDQGWLICYRPRLVNQHLPPQKRPEQLRQQMLAAERARGLVQVRLRRRRGRLTAAVAWSAVAAVHAAISAGRHADPARLGCVLNGIRLGWSGANL